MTYRRGLAYVIAATVIWSLMGLVVRQIEVANSWQVLFYRSLGAVPVLALVAARAGRGPLWPRLRAVGWHGLAGAMGLVVAFACAIYGLQHAPIANVMFLYAATPPITALLGWAILGERVRPLTLAAIAVAALGIFVMVREGLAMGHGLGNAAALMSSVGFAVFTIALRAGRSSDMLPATFLGAFLSALFSGLYLAAADTLVVPLTDGLWALGLGVFVLGVGMGFYTFGSRVVPAAELGLLTLIETLLAPVWVWLVLGERASPQILLGGAILLVAIVMLALPALRGRRPYLARRKNRARA